MANDDFNNVGKQVKDLGEAAKNMGDAAKSIADAARTSVDTVKEVAAFVDGVFGSAISNVWGLMSDKLAYYRLEKAVELHHNVEEKLRKRGVKKRYVPVAFGLPILEKATIEDDKTLQERWANLLANAQDATYDKPLRRNYTSILGDMEALDVLILNKVVGEHLASKGQPKALYGKAKLAEATKVPINECENSIRNLIRLGLFKPGVVTGSIKMGGHNLTAYKDTESFDVTPMGVDFYYAVNDQAK
jgi:hypothetical protein